MPSEMFHILSNCASMVIQQGHSTCAIIMMKPYVVLGMMTTSRHPSLLTLFSCTSRCSGPPPYLVLCNVASPTPHSRHIDAHLCTDLMLYRTSQSCMTFLRVYASYERNQIEAPIYNTKRCCTMRGYKSSTTGNRQAMTLSVGSSP